MPDPVSDRLLTKPFLLVSAAATAFFIYVGVLVPIVPRFIEQDLNGGELGIGLNIAAFAVAAIAARPTIAALADRHGRRAVMIGGSLLAALAGVLAGMATTLPVFLALRALTGVGEAALFVGAATTIADLAPPHRRAEAASYFSVAVFGGIGVGPLLGEAVLGEDRFPLAFAVAAGFAVLAAIASLAVPTITRSGDGEPPRMRFLHPAAVGPGAVLGCGVAGFAVFAAFVPDHALDVGMSGSGALFATYSVVCLTVRIAGARLPERLGPRLSVTIALVTEAIALVLLAAVAEVWALWTAAAVIGFGLAFMYPSLMALTVNRVDARERAGAVSSFTMFFEIGSATGGLALGALAELTGKRVGFLGGVAMCVAGLVILRTRVVPADPPVQRAPVDVRYVPVAGD